MGRSSSPKVPHTLPKELEQLRYRNESEVAALIGFAVQSLLNWRFLGRGPSYVKTGRSVRYRLTDVLDWMESRRVEPRE